MQTLSVQDTQTLFQCVQHLDALQNLETFSIEARSILKSLFPHTSPQIKIGALQSDIIPIDLTVDLPMEDLSDRDRLLKTFILPHLDMAYRKLQNWDQWQEERLQIERTIQQLSLIFLDLSGQVKRWTDPAIDLLKKYFTLPIAPQQLPIELQTWVQNQCDRLNRKPTVSSSSIVFHMDDLDKKLVIRLIHEKAYDRYILQLDEAGPLDLDFLGFPPKETEVLHWLMDGQDAQQIAKEMKIHIGTVRKHSHSLYKKLGVQSQAGAMAQVLKRLGYF